MGPREGETEEEYKARKRAEHEARKTERPPETEEERKARHERERAEKEARRLQRERDAAAVAGGEGEAAPPAAPAPAPAPAAAAPAAASGEVDRANETREERAARHERERAEKEERRRKREEEKRLAAEAEAAAAPPAPAPARQSSSSSSKPTKTGEEKPSDMGNPATSDADARAAREAERAARKRAERGEPAAASAPAAAPVAAAAAEDPSAAVVVPEKKENETPAERQRRHELEKEARRRRREADAEAAAKVVPSSPLAGASRPGATSGAKDNNSYSKKAAEAYDQGYNEDFEDVDDLANDVARWIKADTPAVRAHLMKTAVPATAAIVEAEGVARAGFDRASLQEQAAVASFERNMQRASALRRVVDLEEVRFPNVADIAPLSQYDLFVRGVGGASKRNTIGEQAPERVSVEVQAERVVMKAKQSSVPVDLGLDPDSSEINTGSAQQDGAAKADDAKSAMAALARRAVDTASLSKFLNRAGSVMLALLDEENELRQKAAADDGAAGGTAKNAGGMLPFATRTASFHAEAVTGHRSATRVVCNSITAQYFIVVHGAAPAAGTAATNASPPRSSPASPTGGNSPYQGMVTVWNVYSPQTPEKVLVAFSEIRDACFSRTRPYLVFGGTATGAVCVWDLRESATLHGGHRGKVAMRLPSYSTDSQPGLCHGSAVQRVVPCGSNASVGGGAAAAAAEADASSVEQLTSVDRTGCMSFWVLSESSQLAADVAAASLTSSPAAAALGGVGGGGSSKDGMSNAMEALIVASMSGGSCVRLAPMGGGAALDASRGVKTNHASGKKKDAAASAAAGAAGGATDNLNSSVSNGSFSAVDGAAAAGGIVATITDAEQSPVDATRLVIAAFTGVAHVSRFGSIAAPVSYGPTRLAAAPGVSGAGAAGSGMTAASTCLAQCRSDPRLLLVGYADGTLRLYLRVDTAPKLTVFSTEHKSIVSVCFAPNTVWLAFALDAAGNVFALDFSTSGRSKPFGQGKAVRGGAASSDVATSLTTFIDERAETRLLIGFSSGAAEVHTFNDSALAPSAQRQKYWL